MEILTFHLCFRAGAGSTVRQRKTVTASKTSKSTPGGGSGAGSTMWRFYSEDSPGLKVYVYENFTKV